MHSSSAFSITGIARHAPRLNWHIFLRLASMLNRWENYRTTREFEVHLARKLFAFFFVDGFLWYFLLAFLHIPFGEQLGRLLGLQLQGFSQTAWMNALVTSIATLLFGTVPLSSIWSVAPTLIRSYQAGAESAAAPLQPCGTVEFAQAEHGPCAPTAVDVAAMIRATTPAEDLGEDSGSGRERIGSMEAGVAIETGIRPRHRRSGSTGSTSAVLQAPSDVGGARVAGNLSSDLSSASDDDLCNPWPRSMRFTSLLARKLPWPKHIQRARHHRRRILYAARRALRRVLDADLGLDAESRKQTYEPMLDLARLALEFGYVMMFTIVWPLTPLACLLISALEQRASAVRLTVASQRPRAGLRCNGLGTGDAWFDIFIFLAWLSIPINIGDTPLRHTHSLACAQPTCCHTQPLPRVSTHAAQRLPRHLAAAAAALPGMIALATQQLDIYFDVPLPPFEKLLFAVVAEHALLALKFVLQAAFSSSDADDQASIAAEAHRRRYLRGVHGLQSEPSGGHTGGAELALTGVEPEHSVQQPRLTSVHPSSGPCTAGSAVTIRGEKLGLAISRGEIEIKVHQPRAVRQGRSRSAEPQSTVRVSATFVSERKITCALPAS